MSRKVHAEIEYVRPNGDKVHSDICPKDCDSNNLKSEEYRKFLHDCLDEWLNNSDGSCGFYIKDESYEFDS